MSTRFLIPVLCIGAVAFACGPRAHNEASAPQKTQSARSLASATAAPRQQGTPRAQRKAEKPSVSSHFSVRTDDSSVHFAFQVINTGKKGVELNFPSGQTYDFVVLDSVGREMWRWGSGRMFTQALRNKSLGGGESLDLQESMKSSPLPPGRYTARALLTSENFPIVEQAEFTVQGTTIASR